jgi:hypothetical protein
MQSYVAQWYTHLTDVGPNDPTTVYGVNVIEAEDIEEAREAFDDLLDVDLFAVPVYRIVNGVGLVEVDTDDLPASWNFDEVVLVDIQEEG